MQSVETQNKKKMIQKVIQNIIKNSESWFDWILRRIDSYVDGGLQPFMNKI